MLMTLGLLALSWTVSSISIQSPSSDHAQPPVLHLIIHEEPESNAKFALLQVMVASNGWESLVKVDRESCAQLDTALTNLTEEARKVTSDAKQHKVPSRFRHWKNCPRWTISDSHQQSLKSLTGDHGLALIENELKAIITALPIGLAVKESNGIRIEDFSDEVELKSKRQIQLKAVEVQSRQRQQEIQQDNLIPFNEKEMLQRPFQPIDLSQPFQEDPRLFLGNRSEGVFSPSSSPRDSSRLPNASALPPKTGLRMDGDRIVDVKSDHRKEHRPPSSIWWHILFIASIISVIAATWLLMRNENAASKTAYSPSFGSDESL